MRFLNLRMDLEKQIRFLESQDTKISEDAKEALLLQINCGNGIPNLVNYYAENKSERVLELLCRVREPYDKVLLDMLLKIVNERKVQEALILLGQIAQQAPSWVPKIPLHPIFKTILERMRTVVNSRSINVLSDTTAGLLFLAFLLPHCCALPNQILHLMFNTFNSACEAYTAIDVRQKKGSYEKMSCDHFAFALREYLHSLYGIYPVNFIAHLRNTIGSSNANEKLDGKKKEAMMDYIRVQIGELRLHPNFIFSSKEGEMAKDRWSQREAHDYLEEIRRAVIGQIPISVDAENERSNSEPGSPSANQASFNSQPFGGDDSSSGTFWNLNDSANLLENINTPPGSVVGTPNMKKRNTVDEAISPLVIASDERPKKRPSTDGGRLRFSSFSNIGSAIKRTVMERRSTTILPPTQPTALIEIESGNEEGRRTSESDQHFDEAEEAVDDVPPIDSLDRSITSHLYVTSPASSSTVVENEVLSPQSTSSQPSRPQTSSEIRAERHALAAHFAEALYNAKKNVKNKESKENTQLDSSEEVPECEEDNVVRSRSSSVHPANTNSEIPEVRSRTHTMGGMSYKGDQSECEFTANDSFDGRSRFSVTSYFTRINRQRFVSECPPVESEAEPVLTTQKERTLERTHSCPVFPKIGTESPGSRKTVRLTVPDESSAAMIEKFPYLKLVEPLQPKYLAELEVRLAAEQKTNLSKYMESSRKYHELLKCDGLADRLPGKIYDDMSQIIEGLPMETQRNLLMARLKLVNQHLMYERSCRMLHANRNRRLFALIKRQEVMECELTNLRQTNCNYGKEVNGLQAALTTKRKELIKLKEEHEVLISQLKDKNKSILKDLEAKTEQFAELEEKIEKAKKEYSVKVEYTNQLIRKLDDGEAMLEISQKQIALLEDQSSLLKRAHAENQQLREQLAMCDRGDERLKSPENDDRQYRALQAALEKITKEKEKERILREELKERNNELESAFKNELQNSNQLRILLDRSSRLLREQNEAAEQKFLSLQLVTQKQEEHINELYVQLETAKDSIATARSDLPNDPQSSMSIPRPGFPPEITSFGSTLSDPTQPYFIHDTRNPTPVSSSIDDPHIDL